VQEEVVNVPVAFIVAETADFVLRDVVLVGVRGASVRLEPTLWGIAQSFQLFTNDSGLLLELEYPSKLFASPPGLQREPRHKIWTSQLPRMVFGRQSLSAHPHEQPRPDTLDGLVLRVSNLILDKLLAGKHLEGCEVVLL